MAALNNVFNTQIKLDQAMQNIIQLLIRGQAVLIFLIVLQLRCRCFGDDIFWNNNTLRAKWLLRCDDSA